MYDRCADLAKFITEPQELRLVNGSEVYISREEDYNIVVDLAGREELLEQLKPSMIFVAQHLFELDNMAQKFDRLHGGSRRFPYFVAIVYIDGPYIILEYWGSEENTQFDVVFERQEGGFRLNSFGTILNIPPDWERAAE